MKKMQIMAKRNYYTEKREKDRERKRFHYKYWS